MVNDKLFGDETSHVRKDPVFRRYMEEYKIIDNQIEQMQRRRGYLSYNEVIELTKLKKMKLAAKDKLKQCKQRQARY